MCARLGRMSANKVFREAKHETSRERLLSPQLVLTNRTIAWRSQSQLEDTELICESTALIELVNSRIRQGTESLPDNPSSLPCPVH
jgi:hypothetical protein